ncbi:MAG TPA: hypothetical protein PLB66_03600 [Bacteroidales bacterium]|nr:hypothetical protein [Bacteroidales bacterium]
MTINNKKFIFIFLFCIGSFFPSYAQFYNGSQLSFGKNRVQHQKFNWRFYRTENYDVYYYPTSKILAEYTTWRAAQFLTEIETFLNYTPTKKIQFIVYNTQADFRESNLAYDNEEFYNQGGVTHIYGTKIPLYFDGNHRHFDNMIRSGIMEVYARMIVEGENIGANISAEHLYSLPNWFYSGLSSFVAEEWNSEIDNHVKNGILSNLYNHFDNLSLVEKRYVGHSIWKYIADKYGKNSIPTILYATRAYRSFEKGVLAVIGIDSKTLLQKWYQHYFVLYKKDKKENDRTLPAGEQLIKKLKKNVILTQIAISPDGNQFAYVTNQAGQIKIWHKADITAKPKRFFKHYYKTEENPDLSYPLLTWHPTENMLIFTLEQKGFCYYYPYYIDEKKIGDRQFIDVEKITDIIFSDNGRYLLFSGFKNGQSDIFLYSLASRSFQYITNDFYDDASPRFSENGNYILFSSNRPVHTLTSKTKTPFYQLKTEKSYNLFLYDYKNRDTNLLRITTTALADETEAHFISPTEFIFLSNESGINNRYYARLDSSISHIDTIIHYQFRATTFPITNSMYNIRNHDFNREKLLTADIITTNGKQQIFVTPFSTDSIATENIPLTYFQSKLSIDKKQQDSVQKEKPKEPSVQKKGFYQIRQSDIKSSSKGSNNKGYGSLHHIDNAFTDGLVFNQQVGQNYYVQYSINKLVTQADISFLNTSYQQFTGAKSPIYLNSGVNALIMVGINDLFENHRIMCGGRISANLDNYEFMFSYENLSKLVDQQIVLYRQSLQSTIDNYLFKQYSNSIFYITKYPFNKYNAMKLTLTARNDKNVMGSLNDYSLQAKDINHFWGGIKLEYIFDSSKDLFTNLWKGEKIKIFAEYQHRIDLDYKYLFVVGFDIRKSVDIYKNITWASRLAGSTNVGTSRLVYYMGGVDNWLFAKFNRNIWVDITKDYAYQTLATNMRGFEQNIRNGTSFILFSTELRLPIVQLLARKKLHSGFLNSIQLIAFTDIGTAWTGLTPYSEDNCLYTRYIYWGPNQTNSIKIKRQVEPFIIGFGSGLRATVLGYFIRLDYAWGLEDFKIYDKKGMFLFSVGFDF